MRIGRLEHDPTGNPMFFTTRPSEPTRRATVTEVKANLARTLEDASRGTETVVTRHKRAMAAVVSPASFHALELFRRAVAQAYESSFRKLAHIASTCEGAGQPSSEVIDLMQTVLQELQAVLDIGPSRTVTTAEGGIDTYFFSAERTDDGSPARYVGVCVDERCDASVFFTDGGATSAEDLSPGMDVRDLAARIAEFLSGARAAPAGARADPG